MNNQELVNQGKMLEALIRSRGYTIYSFAKKTNYAKSALYRLCKGEQDILVMEMYNFIIFAKCLGYKNVMEFARDLKLDILDDIKL